MRPAGAAARAAERAARRESSPPLGPDRAGRARRRCTSEIRADAAADARATSPQQGVAVKVISGDNPRTVGAIAASARAAGAATPRRRARAARRPTKRWPRRSESEVGVRPGDAAARSGRWCGAAGTRPHGRHDRRRRQRRAGPQGGRHRHRHGIGTAAARAVAQLVLLDDKFSAMPSVVAEGRRVIANVERVANLFVTKTVYATVLALTVGVARLPFPFLPRHLTLVSA